MPFWTPDEIYVDEQGNPIDPPAGAFAPPPLSPQAAGASPSIVPPTPVDQVARTPGGPGLAGGGYSVSHSGTPQSARDAAASGFAGDQAREQEKAARGFQTQVAPLADTAQRRMDAVGTEEELAGAPSLASATAGQFDAQRRMELYQAELMNRFAEDEKMAMVASQTIVQKARAEYQAEVMEFQAMEVNPGELWGSIGAGGKAQSLASIFVHNFLGVKGIPTTAMDTLNRAIDHSIEAQIQNIAAKGKSVDFFGQMYGMVRDESASDAEARQRLRGFYLAQADKLVAAELSKYDAPLAQAKLAESRLMIQDQLNKDVLALDDVWQQRAQVGSQQWLSMRQAQLSASMEARRITEDARQFNETQKAKAGAGKGFEGRVYFDVDPTSPNFGKPQGLILEGMSEGETAHIRAAGPAAMSAITMLAELRDRVESKGAQYGGDMLHQLLTSEEQKDIAALQTDIGYALARVINGPGVLTKDDVAFAMRLVPLDTVTTWGEVGQVINNTQQRVKDKYDLVTAGKVRKFKADDDTSSLRGVEALTNPSEGARHKKEADAFGKPLEKTPVDDAIERSLTPNGDHAEWLEIASGHAVHSGDKAEIQKVLKHIEQIKKGVYVSETGSGIGAFGDTAQLAALKEDLTTALGGPSLFEAERDADKQQRALDIAANQELLK